MINICDSNNYNEKSLNKTMIYMQNSLFNWSIKLQISLSLLMSQLQMNEIRIESLNNYIVKWES